MSSKTAKKQALITTKTGDDGTSALANGKRLRKDSSIFNVLGGCDELNTWIGVVIAHLPQTAESQRKELLRIQADLYQLSAVFAQAPTVEFEQSAVKRIEKASATIQQTLDMGWQTRFLYPGGSPSAAWCDVARTVARRVERDVIAYTREHDAPQPVMHFFNRISDFLYLLRCWLNQEAGVTERHFEIKK
ncbi:MAG: cob(I)yrinic acid a,c-diamide adenosyltransferase [Patescibacteria group bacterium]